MIWTAAQLRRGIFRVEVDWDTGQAYSEFMSEAQSTGSNDGTVDPRSADAFTDIDADSPVLLRNPQLIQSDGGNDDLRGGAGNDQMFGNAGDDTLHGGEGADRLSGNQGNDNMSGGTGADTLTGGSGDDHLWGGNWRGDGTTDTFVVSHDAGRDIIHDFETDHDRIDLSAYGLDYAEVEAALSDRGWATELDLSALAGDGSVGDRLLLKSVDVDDLDESNFIL